MGAGEKRVYTSRLREQQAEETRRRILEGATRVLAAGASALTVPEVAREAGVAVPTVYRYFGSKEALEDAVAESVRLSAGVSRTPLTDLDGLEARVRGVWGGVGELPRTHLAVLMASVGRELVDEDEARKQGELRIAQVREAIAHELPDGDPEEIERIAKVASALASSPGGVAFLRLGIGLEEAADLYMDVVGAMIAQARSR
ncbi:MAG: TetR/AcrR family transcriptional regulator [Alphaproteobacteria bacterium]|nr:TetR/AcrR family transcriptional regulator [Alphaproteobacteria bacterium]MCB9696916.1 TetR/AcrR family transcriptional regulator [Alphaproteobacteria bacterium]